MVLRGDCWVSNDKSVVGHLQALALQDFDTVAISLKVVFYYFLMHMCDGDQHDPTLIAFSRILAMMKVRSMRKTNILY